jgi:hypothetical protein
MKAWLQAFADRPIRLAIIMGGSYIIGKFIVAAVYHRPFTPNEVGQAVFYGCLWGGAAWLLRRLFPSKPRARAEPARPAAPSVPLLTWPLAPELVLTLVGIAISGVLFGYVVWLTLRH